MSLEMKYFVLRPRAKQRKDIYALASQVAMRAYAFVISDTDPEFAKELEYWSNDEAKKGTQLPPGQEASDE